MSQGNAHKLYLNEKKKPTSLSTFLLTIKSIEPTGSLESLGDLIPICILHATLGPLELQPQTGSDLPQISPNRNFNFSSQEFWEAHRNFTKPEV